LGPNGATYLNFSKKLKKKFSGLGGLIKEM
jgi:hypothetical protein